MQPREEFDPTAAGSVDGVDTTAAMHVALDLRRIRVEPERLYR